MWPLRPALNPVITHRDARLIIRELYQQLEPDAPRLAVHRAADDTLEVLTAQVPPDQISPTGHRPSPLEEMLLKVIRRTFVDRLIRMPLAFSWTRGAESTKTFNALSRPGNLIATAAESTLAVTGALATPWLLPLAFLVLWRSALKVSTVDLDERAACVMWTAWHEMDSNHMIDSTTLQRGIAKQLNVYGRPEMTDREFENVIQALLKLRCLKEMPNPHGTLCVAESLLIEKA